MATAVKHTMSDPADRPQGARRGDEPITNLKPLDRNIPVFGEQSRASAITRRSKAIECYGLAEDRPCFRKKVVARGIECVIFTVGRLKSQTVFVNSIVATAVLRTVIHEYGIILRSDVFVVASYTTGPIFSCDRLAVESP